MKRKIKNPFEEESTSQLMPVAAPTPFDGLRSIEDVQKIFQVSRKTLYNWDKSGILQSRKLGGKIFYLTSDIISALNKAGRELRTPTVNEDCLDLS